MLLNSYIQNLDARHIRKVSGQDNVGKFTLPSKLFVTNPESTGNDNMINYLHWTIILSTIPRIKGTVLIWILFKTKITFRKKHFKMYVN